MKKHELLLMRHGKSDWSTGVDDFDRPLKKRGRKNAKRMGRYMVEQNMVPDYIISSPARRALNTAQRICDVIGIPAGRVQQDSRIYGAGLDDLMQLLQELPEIHQRVLLIGHNPGLEHLLIHLCPALEIPEDGKLLPTATLARLGLHLNWSQVAMDTGQLLSLTRPRSLPE